MKPRITVAIAIPFLLAACSHSAPEYDVTPEAPQPAPAGVTMAGTWLYNPDASDQPGQMGGGGYGGGRRGGFGGGFGGRGGFGGGGRGEGGNEGGGRRRGGGQPDSSMTREPPGRLVIAQDDSSLTISPRTPRDSVSNTLFFDGRVVSATALGGAVETLRGRWYKNQFVVSRDLPGGGTLTESYEVTKHGQRLVIHVKVDRGRNASEQERVMPEFRRVYDKYGS